MPEPEPEPAPIAVAIGATMTAMKAAADSSAIVRIIFLCESASIKVKSETPAEIVYLFASRETYSCMWA